MKILKFGGTSVSSPDHAERTKQLVELIASMQDKDIAVVVSAFGGVTDRLLEMARLAAVQNAEYKKVFEAVKKRHIEAVKDIIKGKNRTRVLKETTLLLDELNDLLGGIFMIRDVYPKTLDLVASFGERLSALIVSEGLKDRKVKADFLDSRTLVKTDDNFVNAKVEIKKTYKNISEYFKKNKGIQVITGFIGSTDSGETTTLGRGGSDYTAALFGAALDVEEIQIWTDVDGVMTADPRKVKRAFPIKNLTYEEAMEMSYFGAKIIYPPTMLPAFEKNIPIRIRNTFNPISEETVISKKKEKSPFLIRGIACINEIALLRIQGSGMIGIIGTSERLFGSLAKKHVNVILITQASSEHSICIAVAIEDSNKAKTAISEEFHAEIKEHQLNEVVIENEFSIISVIGENMRNTPGIAGRVFNTLGENNISVAAIAQGSSELNISTVINKKDQTKAMNAIHESFFFSDVKTLNVFLIGPGLVGSTLLKQMEERATFFNRNRSLEIKLIGIMNSKKMLFDEEGISLKGWKNHLENSKETPDLNKFIAKIKELNLHNSVFVDCTSSEEVASKYEEILASGISIATPNKKASSGDMKSYIKLGKAALKGKSKFLNETNAGAGLPVISTLQGLLNSGDEMLRIEAVLSGTLSYIFNSYDGKIPFSAVVKQAQEKGYTEPDPRDDLNGLDVARKLLILARESGETLELKDVQVENLVPEKCRGASSVDDFFGNLKKEDKYFEAKLNDAKKHGKKLCYIGKIENKKASVSLEAIEPTHPFYNLSGSDNIISFTTRRYNSNPLVVKGPGAGAEVTAAGVFADMLKVANYSTQHLPFSKEEFQEKLRSENLVISLIGMSNIGKTYWSNKLNEIGFEHINCDDLIEEKLKGILMDRKHNGIAGVAQWLGQPYEKRFKENQQEYLRKERDVMNDVYLDISEKKQKNIVVDTTGSFIHTGISDYFKLKRSSLIVYIRASEEMKEDMRRKYIECPKPVVWGQSYERLKGESEKEALGRSYVRLLDYRASMYEKLSDVVVDYDEVYKSGLDGEQFLKLIKSKL